MQSYTEIPSNQTVKTSLSPLLGNDKTIMSCSAGTAFPTANLQQGMLCYRTDLNQLYELVDLTPTWFMICDLGKTYLTQEAADARYYQSSLTLDQIQPPAANVNMNAKRLQALLDPSGTQDAATKNYVDTSIASSVASLGTIGAAAHENIGNGLADDGASNLTALLHGQCRFDISGTNVVLVPFDGCFIRIAGKVYAIPAGGVVSGPTGCHVNGVLGNLAASTIYYVYVFNNGGTLALDFCTTGHTTDTTAGNVGVEIKNGDNSRTLVGAAITATGGGFSETTAWMGVSSWFNRWRRPLQGTTVNVSGFSTSGGWAVIGGTITYFWTWAGESVRIDCKGYMYDSSSTQVVELNLSFDGSATPGGPNTAVEYGGELYTMVSCGLDWNAAEGWHYVQALGYTASSTGVTWVVGITGVVQG
jgi:hypothetical protein